MKTSSVLIVVALAACSTYTPPPQASDPLWLNQREPAQVLASLPINEATRAEVLEINGPPRDRMEDNGIEHWSYAVLLPSAVLFRAGGYYVLQLSDGVLIDARYSGLGPCNGLKASEIQSGAASC